MTQKEITEYIMNNLDKLASTDLMQIHKISKEIVDKRMEKCAKEGMFGKYNHILDNHILNGGFYNDKISSRKRKSKTRSY